MVGCESKITKGIIIRNGLDLYGSWPKRVKHWDLSFRSKGYETEIIAGYPHKPDKFKNGTDNMYFLQSFKLFKIVEYLCAPFLITLYLLKKKPHFVLLGGGSFFEYFPVYIYCKLKKTPILIDIVDTIGRSYKSKKKLKDRIIILNKLLFDKYIVKHALEIFVISSLLESKYKNLFPNKKITRSIPTTVDIKSFKDTASKGLNFINDNNYEIFKTDKIKFFYAGTITRLNGIEFFLNATLRTINSGNNNIVIIFAIIEGDVLNIIELIKRLKMEAFVTIVPPIKQDLLPIFLNLSDILIIPEQGLETANAGFPGKTSEYLMSGRPIITTNFSDLGNYLQNGINAMISEIGDTESYDSNLLTLINDENVRNTIGENGRLLAEKQFSHLECAIPFIDSLKTYQKFK